MQGGTRVAKAICVLGGGLGQGAILEMPSRRQQRRCYGALITLETQGSSPPIPGGVEEGQGPRLSYDFAFEMER